MMPNQNRSLPLTPEQKAEARQMWEGGATADTIAKRFSVTKNAVSGMAHRGLWLPHGKVSSYRYGHESTTLFDRCDALHAKLDAVLAENLGVGRVPNLPRTA